MLWSISGSERYWEKFMLEFGILNYKVWDRLYQERKEAKKDARVWYRRWKFYFCKEVETLRSCHQGTELPYCILGKSVCNMEELFWKGRYKA